jgi:hypothetical protein
MKNKRREIDLILQAATTGFDLKVNTGRGYLFYQL